MSNFKPGTVEKNTINKRYFDKYLTYVFAMPMQCSDHQGPMVDDDYKAINGLAPEYISELIKLKTGSRYNLRSSTELLLEKAGTTTLTTLGDRSFEMAAPTLWNSLSAEIRNACNVATFKKMLKTHFF